MSDSAVANEITQALESQAKPRSLAISSGGIRTGTDFANLMSAVMSDLIDGRMNPNVGNAVCNAGGRLLKVVEMQHKYGRASESNGEDKVLQLTKESK